MFTSCVENGILQDSFEPSNDNTNVVNALQEPFVVNQDPGKNSSQSPLQINHHCCYGCGDPLEDIFFHQCTYELCGKGAHYGYNCLSKVPIIPNPEPFNNQTIKELHQLCHVLIQHATLKMGIHSLMIPHLILFMIILTFSTHLCNLLCILVNFAGTMLDMVTVVHLKFRLSIRNSVTIKTLISQKIFMIFNNNIFVVKIARLLMKLTNKIPACYDDDDDDYTIAITPKEPDNSLTMGEEHLDTIPATESDEFIKSSVENLKIPACYDDDDDDYTIAITPKEPDNSLTMGEEHLDTIPETESDEFIKSSVENLVPNPSEFEGKHECDVPACEVFTTFSNILFDADYNFYSVDDQSFSDEDILKKIYSNPLFDEKIISMKIDPHHFNVDSDLIESLLNHDSSIISSSSKIDSLFDEINETDCDPENETHFIKRLLYDNSSPRPPEEFISKNSDASFESFSPSLIPVEDGDSLVEEIDLSFTLHDLMPPGIEEDDYDSERNILILEEFLILMPRLMSTQPTLVPNQEKSPDLLPHLGHEAFQPSVECPMMIYGKNTPILDVPFFHFYPP
nr:hypothetical protein [Tanacetum cinerariifolium]